jgi:hypothetical protein
MRRGLLEDLPLFLKDPHPAAELAQLLLFGAGQSIIAAPRIQVGLLDPHAQALLRDTQILGDLRQRLAA